MHTYGCCLSLPFAYPTARVCPFGEYCAAKMKFLHAPSNFCTGSEVRLLLGVGCCQVICQNFSRLISGCNIIPMTSHLPTC
eukprot:UN14341